MSGQMRRVVWMCALIGVSGVAVAHAQNPPLPVPVTPPATTAPAAPAATTAAAAPATPAPASDWSDTGTFDLGVRGTTYSGDPARYNQFRDLSNGLFAGNIRNDIETKNGWFLSFIGDNAGRRDATYAGEAVLPGSLKLWASWDQVPWLVSDTTKTLYSGVGTNTLRIPDFVQSILQTTPTQISTVVAAATPFTLQSERKYSTGGAEFMPNVDTTLKVEVQHMDRSGVIAGAGSFGFSSAVELPVPVDHHQSDMTASAERTSGPWLFRGGYNASWFHNDNQSLTFDNPFQATNTAAISSDGRMALAPDDFSQTASGAVSVKLPAHSRMTATASLGSLTDNVTLLPETVNTALPTIALDRPTSEGDIRTTSSTVSFTSRPMPAVDVDVRYRYVNIDDRTPIFTQTGSRIGYDSTVETLATPNTSDPFSVAHNTFDASANIDTGGRTMVGFGYSRDGTDYTYRIFAGSVTNAARVTFDTLNTNWFVLHGRYEHSERRGHDLDTSELLADGEQTTLQTFDIADLNEDVGILTGSLLLGSSVAINLSSGAGQDIYPNNTPQTGLGLASTLYRTYGIGLSAVPNDHVAASVSYDLNAYQSMQWSRSANPGVQAADPTRDWSANGNDRTHSVLADVDLHNIIGKLRVKFSGNFNRGTTLYLYGLAPVTTLPAVSQLPPVMSELRRGTIDFTYPLKPRVTLGFAYWIEQYRVADFALDQNAQPQLNLTSVLAMDNVLLPYRAQTVSGRLIYRW